MQTFLPYPDFQKSASVLDRMRLGKQRVETLQIMGILSGVSKGWANHPAVKMWEGYECVLLEYQKAICEEWTGRGYKDTCLEKTKKLHSLNCTDHKMNLPKWFGNQKFHVSHQSNLSRKFPRHYNQFWDTPANLGYFWPTKNSEQNPKEI